MSKTAATDLSIGDSADRALPPVISPLLLARGTTDISVMMAGLILISLICLLRLNTRP